MISRWLGRLGYAEAVAAQEAVRERILGGDERAASVLLCEHPPVITRGRSARAGHVVAAGGELARLGVQVHDSSRGGDVTYHGPGQLMVYPVVRLRRGVVVHLETVAGVLAEVAAELGAPGARFRRAPTGLWLGEAKLAACGLHVRRGVAIHGFALDVDTPPAMWRLIVPCGIQGVRTVSLAAAAGGAPPVAEVAERVGPRLAAALAPSAPAATMEAQP
ncbi:MAG TPA: lipoyl(octanoyl) transferase LipB [Kofleriaceae bacterium]|nr:lipoyl(octanoyl) transferase LipB [Kofleriaceae bacterium]